MGNSKCHARVARAIQGLKSFCWEMMCQIPWFPKVLWVPELPWALKLLGLLGYMGPWAP
jgi:hypothetical protein